MIKILFALVLLPQPTPEPFRCAADYSSACAQGEAEQRAREAVEVERDTCNSVLGSERLERRLQIAVRDAVEKDLRRKLRRARFLAKRD